MLHIRCFPGEDFKAVNGLALKMERGTVTRFIASAISSFITGFNSISIPLSLIINPFALPEGPVRANGEHELATNSVGEVLGDKSRQTWPKLPASLINCG